MTSDKDDVVLSAMLGLLDALPGRYQRLFAAGCSEMALEVCWHDNVTDLAPFRALVRASAAGDVANLERERERLHDLYDDLHGWEWPLRERWGWLSVRDALHDDHASAAREARKRAEAALTADEHGTDSHQAVLRTVRLRQLALLVELHHWADRSTGIGEQGLPGTPQKVWRFDGQPGC